MVSYCAITLSSIPEPNLCQTLTYHDQRTEHNGLWTSTNSTLVIIANSNPPSNLKYLSFGPSLTPVRSPLHYTNQRDVAQQCASITNIHIRTWHPSSTQLVKSRKSTATQHVAVTCRSANHRLMPFDAQRNNAASVWFADDDEAREPSTFLRKATPGDHAASESHPSRTMDASPFSGRNHSP